MTLTRPQLSTLSKELDRLYMELLEEVREELSANENQQMAELMGHTPTDSADISFADALADLNVDIVDRHIHEMRDIEAARQRMREQNYGICIDCGVDIAFDRLMAHPTAKRCLPCQQRREKMYAGQATPKL